MNNSVEKVSVEKTPSTQVPTETTIAPTTETLAPTTTTPETTIKPTESSAPKKTTQTTTTQPTTVPSTQATTTVRSLLTISLMNPTPYRPIRPWKRPISVQQKPRPANNWFPKRFDWIQVISGMSFPKSTGCGRPTERIHSHSILQIRTIRKWSGLMLKNWQQESPIMPQISRMSGL